MFNPFNKRIVSTRGSAATANSPKLWQVTKTEIQYSAYIETIQTLMSIGINKAKLSPTTLGLTGLESINSSAESQEAREKTSLRTRERRLMSWTKTLTELLNKYLQVLDYIQDREPNDYSDLIKIHFDDYISPSAENITEVLARQVEAGIKSKATAVMDLNPEFDEEDAVGELTKIQADADQGEQTNSEAVAFDNMGIPPTTNGNSQNAAVNGESGIATLNAKSPKKGKQT